MQVATLFRESATLLGAASMIESPSSNSSSSLLSSSSLVSSTNSILGGGGGGGGGGNIGCSSGNITITTMDNCCGIDNGYFNHSNCQNNSNSLMVMANNCAASGNDDVPIKSELSPELSSMMPATTAIGEHDSTLNGNLTNFVCNPAENDNNKQHLIVDLPKQQVTCLIDHNHGYKLLSPTGKPEVHDDGYETSNGATPNRNNSNSVMMLRHEIPLPSDDPYNFIDDDNFTQYHHHHIHHHHRHHHHDPNEMGHIGEQTDLSPAAPLPPSSQPNNHQMQTNSQQQQQQQQQISNHHHINMQHQGTHNMSSHITNSPIPKKRGRKKKNGGGSGGSGANLSTFDGVNEINHNMGMIKSIVIKERKKHDRFNGMSEEEVTQRTLPDHLANNLDIIIIGINPGLFAAYKGHHYAGPGNHFWKCLYLSGLTRDQMTADDDYKLMDFGIGFTNMVSRPTKGSADLTRKEIKEGSRLLMEKLKKFRPKIAVFNGKLIYEVFSGKKDFNFGRQAGTVDGTNTYMWVMPSSSARCAQLPRAADKVPFYTALKKFRDYLNGIITELDETDIIVNEPIKYQNNNISNSNNSIENNSEFTMNNNNNNNSYNINVSPIKSELEEKSCCEIMNLDNNSSNSCLTDLSGSNINNNSSSNNNSNLINYNSNNPNMMTLNYSNYTMDGTTNHQLNNLLSNKKKRGRPKKDKTMTTLNEHNNTTTTFSDNTSNLLLIDSINKTIDSNPFNYNHHNIYNSSDIIKKKRGRPKKVKMNGNDNSSNSSNNPNMEYNNYSNQNFCIPQAENSPTLLEIGYNTNNNNNTNIINSSGENGNANNNSDTNNNSNNNDNSSSESKKCSGNTENGGTDVATKSLSGLESLVDQIPSITDDGRSSGGTTNPGSILDANDHQYNNNSKNNCLYTNNFTTSQQPSSTYLLPTNMPSPTSPQHHHHYNFIESPHIPVPVNPLYHHHHHHHHHPSLSYGQNYQTTYATGPPPPTLHMPSPNYPYGYTNASAYGHTSPQNTTYMNNHSHHHQHHNQSTNMFDRMSNANPIKSSVTELNGNFENF